MSRPYNYEEAATHLATDLTMAQATILQLRRELEAANEVLHQLRQELREARVKAGMEIPMKGGR